MTARLIMISKPQGGLRPIRIECAIMRFMSATAAALARVVVSPLLRPIQLGGGLKCGVEFGARLLDAAYAREDAVISIDIANAFNTARHRAIWDGLADKCSLTMGSAVGLMGQGAGARGRQLLCWCYC